MHVKPAYRHSLLVASALIKCTPISVPIPIPIPREEKSRCVGLPYFCFLKFVFLNSLIHIGKHSPPRILLVIVSVNDIVQCVARPLYRLVLTPENYNLILNAKISLCDVCSTKNNACVQH